MSKSEESLSVESLAQSLRIDYIDFDIRTQLEEKIQEAQIYIDSCVGTEYKKYKDKVILANLLVKKIAGDLFDNPELRINSNKNGYDKISSTILDILSNCGG